MPFYRIIADVDIVHRPPVQGDAMKTARQAIADNYKVDRLLVAVVLSLVRVASPTRTEDAWATPVRTRVEAA